MIASDLLRALPDRPMRRLRLASGVVLLAYLATHMLNHTLGLIGLDAAEAGLAVQIAFWHSPPMTALLALSALVHLALAFSTLFTRRNWRLPPIEVLRLASGFSLPLLLLSHVLTTRVSQMLYDTPLAYRRVIASLVSSGSEGWQMALLAPGWAHGCLGLWITLVRVPAFARRSWLFLGLAVALPVLSAAGFARMRLALMPSPPLIAPLAADQAAVLAQARETLVMSYLVLIVLTLAAGQVRAAVLRRKG